MIQKMFFSNGHLIYGKPGVGKGFLLECIANECGLPIETVTREQLEQSLLAKEQSQKTISELESDYANFLGQRIEAARSKMQKFGSVASILFIDEMEAEFLNRNSPSIDQRQLTRTNVMLRVIEKKISENPDIIFVGATNHIDQVDEAARRVGRFGIPWKINYPDEADVKGILAGNFNQLGFDNDKIKEFDAYGNLVEQCVGLTPLTISQSITNYICLLSADNDSSESTLEINETVLNEIVTRIRMLKEQFKERDAALKEKSSFDI